MLIRTGVLLVVIWSLEIIVTARSALVGILEDFGDVLTCEVLEAAWHTSIELMHVVGVVAGVSVKILRWCLAHVMTHMAILGTGWSSIVVTLHGSSRISNASDFGLVINY